MGQFWKHQNGRAYIQVKLELTLDRPPCVNNPLQAHTRTKDKFSLYRQGQRWCIRDGDMVLLRSAEDSLHTLPTSKDSYPTPPTSGWELCQSSRWVTVPQMRAREGRLAVCHSLVIEPFLGSLGTFLPVQGEWSYGRPVRDPWHVGISTNSCALQVFKSAAGHELLVTMDAEGKVEWWVEGAQMVCRARHNCPEGSYEGFTVTCSTHTN